MVTESTRITSMASVHAQSKIPRTRLLHSKPIGATNIDYCYGKYNKRDKDVDCYIIIPWIMQNECHTFINNPSFYNNSNCKVKIIKNQCRDKAKYMLKK